MDKLDEETKQDIMVETLKKGPPKKVITAKQKAARQASLAKARAIRMKAVNKRKSAEQQIEYDVEDSASDPDSESEVDLDEFMVTKKGKGKKKTKDAKDAKDTSDDPNLADVKKEIQELRGIMFEMNKKHQKAARKRKPGTKIVLLPNQGGSGPPAKSPEYDHILNQLFASINRK